MDMSDGQVGGPSSRYSQAVTVGGKAVQPGGGQLGQVSDHIGGPLQRLVTSLQAHDTRQESTEVTGPTPAAPEGRMEHAWPLFSGLGEARSAEKTGKPMINAWPCALAP